MKPAACVRTAVPCTDARHCSDSDRCNRTATADDPNACHCLSCCYATTVPTPSTVRSRRVEKTTATVATTPAETYDHDEPPSEAAAFVASASAAAFILLAALLAVILSSAALWTVASMVPMADAAADVRPGQPQATDYLHRWHNQQQQQQQQQQQPYLWRPQQRGANDRHDDAQRQKRQLFKKSRDPGVIALTFSLIGGTVSDIREAYRNVSGIVQDTINEAAKLPTTTAAVDGDQMMMAAGNTVENEISGSAAAGSATTVAPAVNQKAAGDQLGKLLGRNYRGLRRLFNSELRSAIKNSPGNIRDFTFELMGSIGQSLRPSRIFTRGPVDDNSTSASSR